MAALPQTNRTIDDIRDALGRLNEGQLARLRLKGRLLAPGTGGSGDDLLHEAILRALKGERVCPADVSVYTFLSNAMRSIADGEREKYDREMPAGDGHDEDSMVGNTADPRPTTDVVALDRIELSRVVSRIEDLFANDSQAMAIVIGDMQGWTADEIKEFEKMDAVEFATARRRVRRAVALEFGERSRNA